VRQSRLRGPDVRPVSPRARTSRRTGQSSQETPEAAIAQLARRAPAVLGRPLTPTELARFRRYLGLLQDWNRAHRLVGSERPTWIVENLFLDSLLFQRLLLPGTSSLLDLGSGAGIPGIPLKIVSPELRLVLAEARRKRASFLRLVVRELGLSDTEVIERRLSADEQAFGARFDAVVARCAGPPASVARVGLGLIRQGGNVIIAGPPSARPGDAGRLVEVMGRHFVVFSRPENPGQRPA
jgi:16S rRNA (guanine527-N7)-methyltransferase